MNHAPAPAPQLADKQPVWKISPAGPKHYINSVAVSADGGRVVGGTFYHHYNAGESRRGPGAPVSIPPAPNPSSETGVFGVYGYNAAGERQWADEFEAWQDVYWVAISADGSRAAAGGFMSESAPQGFVRAYDAKQQGRLLLSHPTQQRVNQVALSADGASLIAAAETLMLFRCLAARGADEMFSEFRSASGHAFVSAAISADGNTVVYADYGGEVGVMTNLNGSGYFTPMARWQVPGGTKADFSHMLDLAPDGRCFAAGGAEGRFYFLDVGKFFTTQAPVHSYDTNVQGTVYGVAVAGDGSAFAGIVNNEDAGIVYCVPLGNGAKGLAKPFPTQHNPNSVVLHAAHGMMAVADGHPDGTPGCFNLFDPISGALRWKGPTGNMSWPIVIAADGSAVVGGSDDSFIY